MRPLFQRGDIVGVKTEGGISSLLGWLAERIFDPPTDLFHFFVIADCIWEENDYVILESIGKGVAVGRLSFYESGRYDVFRVKQPDVQELGWRACLLASKFGRQKYDYLLGVKLFFGVLRCFCGQIIKERRIHRIRPAELPYVRDGKFACTEFANEIWRQVGYPLVPKGVAPMPASIYQAFVCGKLELIFQNY